MTAAKEINYIYNHTSEESSIEVQDYPWGFRLRTEQRYWIESKDAKRGGQRFVTQTKNPKTGRWCKPKKTTYSHVLVMFTNEKGHVRFTGLDMYCTKESVIKFYETHKNHLDDFQKKQLNEILAYQDVMQHVTFSINHNPTEQSREEQKEITKKLDRAFNKTIYKYNAQGTDKVIEGKS